MLRTFENFIHDYYSILFPTLLIPLPLPHVLPSLSLLPNLWLLLLLLSLHVYSYISNLNSGCKLVTEIAKHQCLPLVVDQCITGWIQSMDWQQLHSWDMYSSPPPSTLSPFSPSWPGAHNVEQRSACLCLPSARTKGVYSFRIQNP